MSSRSLGRYELLEQLGEGGMGAVWLARLSGAAGFEKLCIVKTVLPSIAKDADFVSRFLHEGRVLTQLQHGNIAQVLDMNEAEGQLFLALEYVAGVDLSRLQDSVRAQNEYMPTSLVVALIAQAAEGLGAAHRKTALDGTPLHVVHRDVSPHNIMVSYEGEVKVIDFGIAKSEARSRHTAQSSVMGKLGYMAPEQARGENVDHRADQYALGIVLWELLSNQPFIRRGTLTEMVVAMAAPTLKPLAGLRADVPPSLEAVVLKALAADPDVRFPDTDAFARALTGELLALGPPPTKPQLGEYVKLKCVAEYTAQRQLLTRISTVRPGGTALPTDPMGATAVRPGPPLPTEHVQPIANTLADRPSTVHADPLAGTKPSLPAAPAPVSTAPLPSPSTQELQALARPARSKTPLLVGLGALVVVLVVAVALTSRDEVTPQVSVDAGVMVVAPVVVDAGALVVVVEPEVDAGAAPPVELPPQPMLKLVSRQTPTSWVLTNSSRVTWTHCVLTAPGQRRVEVGSLRAGSAQEVFMRGLRSDASAPVLVGQLRVDCDQGFAFAHAR